MASGRCSTNSAPPEPRIVVLASGRGSNLRAIVAACESGEVRARVAAVISDVPEAAALDFARGKGIEAVVVARARGEVRGEHDARLLAAIGSREPSLVCLAGYMKIVAHSVVEAFRWRILNIHPSLLPSFPGLHAVRQALDAGVKVSGCTVHFVDEGLDSGPILVQRAVPVLDEDGEGSLAARILEQEHRAYPEAIRKVLAGDWRAVGRRVVGHPASPERGIAEAPAAE